MTAEPVGSDRPALRIAVVGGGISGLVAARELAMAGCEVTLYERDERLGGRIRGAEACGVSFDIGAESFATRGGGVRELLAELGLEAEITAPSPRGAWVVSAERAAPLPASGTLGIPAAPLSGDSFRALGASGALRAAVEPMLPRSVGTRGAGSRGSAPTLASIVRARLGSRTLDRLVRPVALGVHSTDPERIAFDALPGLAAAYSRTGSLIAAARELRGSARAAGGAVAGLRGGMTALVDALAADVAELGVRVETGAPVVRLSPDRDGGPDRSGVPARGESRWEAGVLIETTHGPIGDVRAERFDGAVLAVPEVAAGGLLAPAASAPAASDVAADRDSAGEPGGDPHLVEIIALVLDDDRLDAAPRGTGALVPESGGPIVAKALTHVTAKWSELAREFGPGRHLLRLSYGRTGSAPETLGLDDADAGRLALDDASRILGLQLADASLRGMERQTWSMGGGPGGGSRAATAPDPHATGRGKPGPDLPTVVVAGDWVSGAGLASVVPGARLAAKTVFAAVARARQAADTALSTHTAAPHHEGTARS